MAPFDNRYKKPHTRQRHTRPSRHTHTHSHMHISLIINISRTHKLTNSLTHMHSHTHTHTHTQRERERERERKTMAAECDTRSVPPHSINFTTQLSSSEKNDSSSYEESIDDLLFSLDAHPSQDIITTGTITGNLSL